MRPIFALTLSTLLAAPAMADRVVTDAERAKLLPAIAAQGCAGGKMEWDDDDREFEVDHAICNDGRLYDLKFDASFQLISKKLEH